PKCGATGYENQTMTTVPMEGHTLRLPRQVAVVGAAGGLGGAVIDVCRNEGIGFTAIVRSRPERIAAPPPGSRIAVVASLADRLPFTEAFRGADTILLAVPTVNPIHWHIQSNRAMLVLDDEYFRADLTCLDRAVALESGTSG